MRSTPLNILTAVAAFSVVPTHHLAAQQADATIGIVDFYGLRQIAQSQVRQALGVAEGDAITGSVLRSAERRLRTLPGVNDARIEGVCCEGSKFIVYVGIEEKASPAVRFNLPPAGKARL